MTMDNPVGVVHLAVARLGSPPCSVRDMSDIGRAEVRHPGR
jgi:hypothetical protein